MKKLILFLAVLFVIAISNFSSAEEKNVEITGKLSGSYYSTYIGYVPGVTAYDGPVFQDDLEIDVRVKKVVFYLEVWHSYSPNGSENNDWGDEVDYIAGVKKEIGRFFLDFNYMYYNFADLKNTKGDLHAFCLNVDFPEVLKITPYIVVEGDIPQDEKLLEGGVLYRAGVRYSPEIFDQPIDVDVSIAGHDGAYGTIKENVSSVCARISTTFNFKGIDITPEISYQKRVGYSVSHGGMTENKFWYGITMTIPFKIY